MNKKIILFSNENECCGCSACLNICPKNAITMEVDDFGFEFPKINYDLCVNCGLCNTVCDYQDLEELNSVKMAYAGANKDIDVVKKSASGGIFSAFAKNVLTRGGTVYGVSLENVDGILVAKHKRVIVISELDKLRGSKYVQSSVGITYKEVKNDLEQGIEVLFSGTPCQIAGLKKFLRKPYERLITVEIICHGVPSSKMFQDFIRELEVKCDIKINDFKFRDKSKGQGMMSNISYKNKNGNYENKIKNGKVISYFSLFLKSLIYRENCYTCPYAQEKRSADITIGDYWGFHEEHPSAEKTSELSNTNGVSCILVNTDKGIHFMNQCDNDLILMPSELSKIAKHNEQLSHPSRLDEKRDILINLYNRDGYEGIEKYYKENYKLDRLKQNIINLIPKKTRRISQKMLSVFRRN